MPDFQHLKAKLKPDFERLKSNWKEIARQFRLPLVIALVWAVANYFFPVGSTIKVISEFATAFFLVSWLYGQYNRVDRQTDTTERLKAIQLALRESSEASARALRHQQEVTTSLGKLSELVESPSSQFRHAIGETLRSAQLANNEQYVANTALMNVVSNLTSNAALASRPGDTLTFVITSHGTELRDQKGNIDSPTPKEGGTDKPE